MNFLAKSKGDNTFNIMQKISLNSEIMVKEVSKEELDRILTQYILASAGVGMIPLPMADIAGLVGVQISMLKKLAELYDVPFFKEAVKKVLSSLVGSILLLSFLIIFSQLDVLTHRII